MSDLVRLLQEASNDGRACEDHSKLLLEAAAAIDKLRSQRMRLMERLRVIAAEAAVADAQP